MEIALYALLTAVYGCISVFVYRLGYTDGKEGKRAAKPVFSRKSEPMSEEEQAAADRQRRIDAFKG